jgi:hypothetical protein
MPTQMEQPISYIQYQKITFVSCYPKDVFHSAQTLHILKYEATKHMNIN